MCPCYWNPPPQCGELSEADYHHGRGECLFATFCCPCYWFCCASIWCCFGAIEVCDDMKKKIPKKPYELKQYEWRQKNAPRPLARRSRTLTLPLQSSTNQWPSFTIKQKTLDQRDSALFRLPLELRQKIWSEAMGSAVVHIGCKEKRLQHTLCRVCDPTDYCTGPAITCWPCSPGRRNPYPVGSAPQVFGILALAKTCRRM